MSGSDMASQNGTFDPIASYARLSERVEGQGKDLVDIRSNMNTGFNQVNTNITTLANETRGNINALANELRGTNRTQWPVIWSAVGVCFTIVVAIGSLAYWPVLSNQERLETALVRLADNSVSRQEMDWRAERGAEDRDRTNNAIADIRATAVSRNEWSERNRARDQEVADLGRRIEEIRASLGSQYTTRDVLLDLQAEVKELRRRRGSTATP